jgi:glycosyltransferase involved in cell wall biosynthesis
MWWALRERRADARKLDTLVQELSTTNKTRISYRACRDMAALRESCASLRLDVLLACLPDLGSDFPVPWCGFLPDVQHRRLRHMFSQAEIAQRDAHFAAVMTTADAILANSRSVADDLNEFFGAARHCTVLPMAWLPLAPPGLQAVQQTMARYGIAGRYFIICNQFWRHKDHETAFRAFAAVKRQDTGCDLTLVCTGDISDYRHADHFSRMTALLNELGIAPQVRILGRIPKEDQVALLSGSLALLQPSLFEGTRGGLAVADALALAKPCIVSDIPVCRELEEPGVEFFKTGDPEDLARQMLSMLAAPPATRDIAAQQKICADRLIALGESLMAAGAAAIASRRTSGAQPTLAVIAR